MSKGSRGDVATSQKSSEGWVVRCRRNWRNTPGRRSNSLHREEVGYTGSRCRCSNIQEYPPRKTMVFLQKHEKINNYKNQEKDQQRLVQEPRAEISRISRHEEETLKRAIQKQMRHKVEQSTQRDALFLNEQVSIHSPNTCYANHAILGRAKSFDIRVQVRYDRFIKVRGGGIGASPPQTKSCRQKDPSHISK